MNLNDIETEKILQQLIKDGLITKTWNEEKQDWVYNAVKKVNE